MKPIKIIGFTPLGVALAERLTYSSNDKSHTDLNITLIEQESSLTIDSQWQSVSLLCLINLLKQCRILQSNKSNKFGLNIQSIQINKQLLYSYIKLATERVQKYYLSLLKRRGIQFKLYNNLIGDNDIRLKENQLNKQIFNSIESCKRLLNIDDFELTIRKPWQSYFHLSSTIDKFSFNEEIDTIYITYTQSSHHEFNYSLRLNGFHAIFQYLLSCSSVKFIGSDIFSFEFAYLLSSLGHNQLYFYRMNPNETSMLPITETNSNLITLFQIFSKSIHPPLIDFTSNRNHAPQLHIIEKYHRFKMNLTNEGHLEYEKFTEPSMPTYQTTEEAKKQHKRTYLETFKQQPQESLIKFSTSNMRINKTIEKEEEEESLDTFPVWSTFFILIDIIESSNPNTYTKLPVSLPKAIRTFNCTPGALIFNIYETLRRISHDETIPQLTNIFLSVDRELCVIKSQTTTKNDQFGHDQIFQSQQHDLHKIIQRPVNESGQLMFYESQLFENDALDLQSLLLLFNPQQEIPKNELIFLFHDEHEWHNLLVLPDHVTSKTHESPM